MVKFLENEFGNGVKVKNFATSQISVDAHTTGRFFRLLMKSTTAPLFGDSCRTGVRQYHIPANLKMSRSVVDALR